nr:MAG TPA: hypothetical protein [Bacteriophage sp.]
MLDNKSAKICFSRTNALFKQDALSLKLWDMISQL